MLQIALGDLGEYTAPSALPGGDGDVNGFLNTAFDAFLPIAIGIAVLMLLISGIQYSLSGGEEEKQATAKRTIKWTVVGLVIALLAYFIVSYVVKILQ